MLNFDWLSGISVGTAKLMFFALYALIGIIVLLIPNDYIFKGVKQEDRHWWMNLKFWSIASLAILSFIYYIF
ncbi:MAG: hypothetical protein ABFS32_08920 [Bacteroidota bacterium]